MFTGLADTKENRRRAGAFLKVIQGQIALGTFDYRTHFPHGARLSNFYPKEIEAQRAKHVLIGDYLDAWQKRRSPFLPDGTVAEAADLHPSTWVHEESVIRCHLKPVFGTLRLDELTPSRCKDFRKALQDKQLSGKTAGNILGVLHKAMADAVEDGLLATNPVPQLTRHRRRAPMRSNSDPLTVHEVKQFLDAVPEWYQDLYDVWFRLGWRPSEILAIRFDWLDFQRQTVHIKRGSDRALGWRRSAAEDRRARGRLQLRPGDLRNVPPVEAPLVADGQARLRVHRRSRQPAVAGTAAQEVVAADLAQVGVARPRSVQHPRHVHQPGVVGR